MHCCLAMEIDEKNIFINALNSSLMKAGLCLDMILIEKKQLECFRGRGEQDVKMA
jgi:hypothetical protein